MKISTAFPSKYIKADEMDEDVTYTIASVEMETVGNGKDASEKPVIYFEGEDKGFVCNKTNATTIGKLHGDDTDDWIGKQITLYATEVEFGGETMLGVRVRLKAPQKRAAAPATKPAATATPAAEPTDSPRMAAFKAFITKTDGWYDADRKAEWPNLVLSEFPGRDQKSLTDEEWAALTVRINEDYNAEVKSFINF